MIMDSTQGKSERTDEEDDDRLSSLPDDLIHKILSSFDIDDAVLVSRLSSRWRYIWTSMPFLNFPRRHFRGLSGFTKFLTHVLSNRNDQIGLYSVDLCFADGVNSDVFVKRIMAYASSHNIQQLKVACFLKNDVEFTFSSRSLKHLTLTKEEFSLRAFARRHCSKFPGSYVIKPTSTWELPSLTTLYLHDVTLCCDETTYECIDFFSRCTNLKNLTLKDCTTKGFKRLSICPPILSTLTLEDVYGSADVLNIVAPQLKNLTIKYFYKDDNSFQLSTEGFNSLEKADIRISSPKDALQVLGLLQKLHNVTSLTLNLEVVELLSASVELMSKQSSPFANLKSLKIHPERKNLEARHGVKMSAEVKSYLLDSSPGADFSIVTREDIMAHYELLSSRYKSSYKVTGVARAGES